MLAMTYYLFISVGYNGVAMPFRAVLSDPFLCTQRLLTAKGRAAAEAKL